MDIADCGLCAIGGFLILCVICLIISWELTIVVMFFWLCFKIELAYENQKKITKNQKTIIDNQVIIEKIIRKE